MPEWLSYYGHEMRHDQDCDEMSPYHLSSYDYFLKKGKESMSIDDELKPGLLYLKVGGSKPDIACI